MYQDVPWLQWSQHIAGKSPGSVGTKNTIIEPNISWCSLLIPPFLFLRGGGRTDSSHSDDWTHKVSLVTPVTVYPLRMQKPLPTHVLYGSGYLIYRANFNSKLNIDFSRCTVPVVGLCTYK